MQIGQTINTIEFWEGLVDLSIKWIEVGIDSWQLEEGWAGTKKIHLRELTLRIAKDPRDWNKIPQREYDSIRLAAKFLIFELIPVLIKTIYKLLRKACLYEGIILIRSLNEALDLLEYLGSDRCTDKRVRKWLKGETIYARDTRKGSKDISFRGKRIIEKEMDKVDKKKTQTEYIKSKLYEKYSRYVHFSASALLQNKAAQQGNIAFETFNSLLLRSMEDYWLFFPEFVSQESKTKTKEIIDDIWSMAYESRGLSDLLSEHYVKRRNK